MAAGEKVKEDVTMMVKLTSPGGDFRQARGVSSGQQAGMINTAFGLTGDLPAPADFDGDGKPDLGIFRPSSGTWYLQRGT